MHMVTGITGRVGGAVARHLLSRGAQVRALVRDRRKAAAWTRLGVEIVEGDWNDASAIAQALSGVEGAFAMLPTTFSPGPDCAEARAMIAAHRRAFARSAPPRLVALSSIGAERSEGIGMLAPLHLMERSFRELPFPAAFVRAGGFHENFLHGLETGRDGTLPVFYPAKAADRVPLVATDDIGRCIADVLMGSPWQGMRTIELGTPTSADELAEHLAAVLGCDVAARAWPRDEWAAVLEGMGVERGRTREAEEMFDAVNSGWIAFGAPDAERIAGRTSARDVFAAALQRESQRGARRL